MTAERDRALSLLKTHGWNTTSFQLLENGYEYFFDGDDAFVAWRDTGSAAVAGGAPVAPPERLAEVAEHFADYARASGKRPCFFAAGQRFIDASGWSSLHIGEQPTWNPAQWHEVLSKVPSLRSQLRRAAAHGVTVRRLQSSELAQGQPARQAVDHLIEGWLKSRTMAPMGFLVSVEPYSYCEERIFFVAEKKGQVVAVLSAVPIYARKGWLFEDLLRERRAPNGTAELLFDAGMRAAHQADARLVTLGLAPLSGDVPRGLLWVRELSKPLYDFAGVHAFKAKLRPHGWEPIYLATPPGHSRTVGLYDSLKAFAEGSLVGFGLRTLARGPLFAIWALTALLAGWVPLLALASPERWFPERWMQNAWVTFDVALLGLLVLLARRYRPWLGVTLASLVTLDAVVTWAQALGWNAFRVRNGFEVLWLVIACAGPSLAATALWGMVRSRSDVTPATPPVEAG